MVTFALTGDRFFAGFTERVLPPCFVVAAVDSDARPRPNPNVRKSAAIAETMRTPFLGVATDEFTRKQYE